MKKNKYIFVFLLLLTVTLVSSGLTKCYLARESKEKEPDGITVVASFYPIYIAAKNVIGDCPGVTLENLSEPQTGCLHDYQLTPADMKLLSKAEVFLVNGGGIETFLSDVAKQYGETLHIVNTTEKIALLEDNAHAWMSPSDYQIQVSTIAEALAEIDPDHAEKYKENAKKYRGKIQKLQDEMEVLKQEAQAQNVILFHEAFAYLAADCDLTVSYVMDLDEERQISAGEVADVVNAIRKNKVHLILAEERYGKEMGDTVEKETDVKVCYLDPLTRGETEADSYLKAMQHNIDQIREVLVP